MNEDTTGDFDIQASSPLLPEPTLRKRLSEKNKLKAEDVKKIRDMVTTKSSPVSEIAKLFGISTVSVYKIASRKLYKWVD